jgi:hypothetical protein
MPSPTLEKWGEHARVWRGARHFDSHDGGSPFEKRENQDAQHVKECVLFVGGLRHV